MKKEEIENLQNELTRTSNRNAQLEKFNNNIEEELRGLERRYNCLKKEYIRLFNELY